MIGVPRLDGVHSAEGLVPAMTAAVKEIAARHTDEAPPVRVLPSRIHLHEIDPNPPGPESDYRTRWTIPVGVREVDPDGGSQPHVQQSAPPDLGAAKSGKTTIAHAIARAICARNSPQQVRFMVADYRSGLLEAVPETHLPCRWHQPQPCHAGGVDQGARGEPVQAVAADRSHAEPASATVLVVRAGRRPARRRLAHDHRGERDDVADGSAHSVATGSS